VFIAAQIQGGVSVSKTGACDEEDGSASEEIIMEGDTGLSGVATIGIVEVDKLLRA